MAQLPENPKVSIVVPVYNVEAFLPQCIDSIRRQTYGNIEIVCVVDGSTDRSLAILRLYRRVEERLVIIEKRNGGLSSARNAGINAATGDIIMFVDSDDMIEAEACAKVVAAFGAHDAECVTFGAVQWPCLEQNPWFDQVLSPRAAYYASWSADILFEEQSHPYVWRTAVLRSVFERTGLRFDEGVQFGEDQIFHFALYPKVKGTAFIPDKLYVYRVIRKDSLMALRTSNRGQMLDEHTTIVQRICDGWEADGLMESCGAELLEWAADFLIPNLCFEPADLRGMLFPRVRELLTSRFSAGQVPSIERENLRDACAALFAGADAETIVQTYLAWNPESVESADGSEPDAAADGAETAQNPGAGTAGGAPAAGAGTYGGPRWLGKLRTVLPMSAQGVERRLNAIGGRMDATAARVEESSVRTEAALGDMRVRLDEATAYLERQMMSPEYARWMAEEAGACARSLQLLQVEIMAKESGDRAPGSAR